MKRQAIIAITALSLLAPFARPVSAIDNIVDPIKQPTDTEQIEMPEMCPLEELTIKTFYSLKDSHLKQNFVSTLTNVYMATAIVACRAPLLKIKRPTEKIERYKIIMFLIDADGNYYSQNTLYQPFRFGRNMEVWKLIDNKEVPLARIPPYLVFPKELYLQDNGMALMLSCGEIVVAPYTFSSEPYIFKLKFGNERKWGVLSPYTDMAGGTTAFMYGRDPLGWRDPKNPLGKEKFYFDNVYQSGHKTQVGIPAGCFAIKKNIT